MSISGGSSEEPWEQRIRVSPRSGRSAPFPPEPPLVERPPLALPPPEIPLLPLDRPDRSRMDPLSLDRSTYQKLFSLRQGGEQMRSGDKKSLRLDHFLILGGILLIVAGGVTGLFWMLRQRLGPRETAPFSKPEMGQVLTAPTDRVSDMLEAFLTSKEMAIKASYVLDAVRVQPLMIAAYANGHLPEAQLRFGTPQPLEAGVWSVPAKVLGPTEFSLYLMVREVQGQPLLDWESYQQEVTRQFTHFVAQPSTAGGEFRLVLERSSATTTEPGAPPTVRMAAPGSPVLAEPIRVRPDLAPSLADALSWDRRRRALVRLRWQTPVGGSPYLLLTEVVKWEFLPEF